MLLPFDLARRRVLGPPVPAGEGIRMDARRTSFAISRNGTLAYVPGPNAYRTRLVWLDYPTGRIDTLPFPGAVYASHALWPDGRQILVHIMEQANDEFRVLDLERGTSIHLATGPAAKPSSARWWTDEAIAGSSTPESSRAAPPGDVRQPLIGYVARFEAQRAHRVTPETGDQARWTADGKTIVYLDGHTWYAVDVSTGGGFQLGRPRALFTGPFVLNNNWSYAVAPDDRRFLLAVGPPDERTSRLIAVTNWFAVVGRLAPPR